MKRSGFLYLCLVTLFACQEDDTSTDLVDFGYNYAPLTAGQSSVFQVDSILYDDFNNSIDTVSFQRKEEIVSDFTNDAGEKAFRIELSRRLNDTLPWRLIRVFSSSKGKVRFEKTDNNESIVLLVFPPSVYKEWDGNLLNTNTEKEFSYTTVGQAETINTISYSEVLTVLQEDEFNRIQQFFTEEKYARNIGLIYRNDKQLETELNGNIRSGYEATVSLIAFKP